MLSLAPANAPCRALLRDDYSRSVALRTQLGASDHKESGVDAPDSTRAVYSAHSAPEPIASCRNAESAERSQGAQPCLRRHSMHARPRLSRCLRRDRLTCGLRSGTPFKCLLTQRRLLRAPPRRLQAATCLLVAGGMRQNTASQRVAPSGHSRAELHTLQGSARRAIQASWPPGHRGQYTY